ncbi:phosphoribosylanthranilate isomerase [Pedobacter namyangjuensis]|uniref:phosphoribosylanthranilate isomerase n=1 Tax=Pedobacter namyangjuensis TaxID=600626 RepID=UPI000DE1D6EA|nr:phosphoribosylanthranilate isomerase [Pedobacter namyangjuensis]
MKFKIKVCGMSQASNIANVAELQPDYLGFIFYDKSPRAISSVSAELIKYVPETIKTVGVFVNEDLELVIDNVINYKLKAIQLHGSEDPAYCEALKETGVEVIKAFGIRKGFEFNLLENYLKAVDYFLFDTQTEQHGGSGKQFDWSLLKNYMLDKPYFLSGGIGLEQIEQINEIDDDRLLAIDVNSRFETEPGFKDINKLKQFFNGLQ